jgi:hypothetical protein
MTSFEDYKKSIKDKDLKRTRALVFNYNNETSKSRKILILKMINQEIEQAKNKLLKVA